MNFQILNIEVEVESETNPNLFYNVVLSGSNWSCNCPAAEFQQKDCKHITFMRQRTVQPTQTKRLTKDDLLNGRF